MQECGEKRASLESVEREKRNLDRELERVRAQQPMDAALTRENMQQLHSRVCRAEQVEQEALRKVESALIAQRAAEAWCVVYEVCGGCVYEVCGRMCVLGV